MQYSSKGLALTKGYEGLRLHAYQDVAGVWTIGYGHTGDVRPGQVITEAEADALLLRDMATAVATVNKAVHVPLSQDQFDAVCDFAFNAGSEAFASSTLLRKLNAGDYAGAQAEFGKWIHAGGVVVAGLVRRRHDEAALFGGK